jgi:hypothetical protein
LFLIFVVVFGSFACLFPLAFYCLVVASLNNRSRPTMVSGPADFAGVLLATTGFLVVGGPLVLSGIHNAWQRSVLSGQSFASIRSLLSGPSELWLFLWVGYFALVVGGSIWLLQSRRTVCVIYNLDVETAHKVIADVLDHLGLPWTRQDSAYAIALAATDPIRTRGAQGLPPVTAARAALSVTATPALRHVTLHWVDASQLVRASVEAELRSTLERLESPENGAGAWFLGAATLLFVILLMLLGLFIAYVWNHSR